MSHSLNRKLGNEAIMGQIGDIRDIPSASAVSSHIFQTRVRLTYFRHVFVSAVTACKIVLTTRLQRTQMLRTILQDKFTVGKKAGKSTGSLASLSRVWQVCIWPPACGWIYRQPQISRKKMEQTHYFLNTLSLTAWFTGERPFVAANEGAVLHIFIATLYLASLLSSDILRAAIWAT